MLKPLVSKFHSDLSIRLKDIVEKQVPAKLKPIVVDDENFTTLNYKLNIMSLPVGAIGCDLDFDIDLCLSEGELFGGMKSLCSICGSKHMLSLLSSQVDRANLSKHSAMFCEDLGSRDLVTHKAQKCICV